MSGRRKDIAALVRELPVLAGLGDDLVNRIASIAPIALSEGDHLFRDGDAAAELFLLIDPAGGLEPLAEVEFRSSLLSRTSIRYRLAGGAFAGAVEFLLSGLADRLPARVCGTRILRPCVALAVPAALAVTLTEASPQFRRRMVRESARGLTDALLGQAGLRAIHPDLRFAAALLDLLDEFGQRAGNRGHFSRRVRQQELADRLGMSRRLLSLRLSDWSSRGLVETVPLSLPDIARLERLAALGGRDLAGNIAAAIADIDGFIAANLLVKASQAATDFLAIFPANPLVSYLLALIASRLDAREDAEAILAAPFMAWPGTIGGLKEAIREAWRRSLAGAAMLAEAEDPEGEEQLDAILGRRLNELVVDIGALRARLEKDKARELLPQSAEFRAATMRASGLYRDVHEATPNYFCAINAATLARVGGSNAYTDLAREAERLAGREDGYWALATRGEAALLHDKPEAARRHLEAALAARDADRGRIAATRRQLDLLATAGVDTSAARSVLDAGRPMAITGGLTATSPAAGSGEPGHPRLSGLWLTPGNMATLAAAEAAIATEVPLHVVLPFPIDAVESLVAETLAGDMPAEWRGRFYACLEGAAEVTILWPRQPLRGEIAQHLHALDQRLAGEAIVAGQSVNALPLIRFVDGSEAKIGKPDAETMAHAGPFAPVVFAFARNRIDNDTLRGIGRKNGFAERTLRDGRLALHALAASHDEARFLAQHLATDGGGGRTAARIVLDHGPVRGRDGAVDLDDLTRLDAADDVTELMIGDTFATAAFALGDLARGAQPRRYSTLGFGIDGDDRRGGIRGRRRFFRVRPGH